MICTNCKEKISIEKPILESIGVKHSEGDTFYRGKGCRKCAKTGYFGRMGILEVFTMDDHIRELIVSKAQSWEIKQYAVKQLGMTPLRQDGLRKAAAGLTSLEEVVHVTAEE